MKACVCGGSNSNCRFCAGSGYVPKDRGLPVKHTRRETFSPSVILEVNLESMPQEKPYVRSKLRRSFKEIITDWAWYLLFLLVTFFITWLVSK